MKSSYHKRNQISLYVLSAAYHVKVEMKSILKSCIKGGFFMDLIEQTKHLKKHLDILKDKYEKNEPPESISDKPFFLNMKEETAPIYDLLEAWEEQALAFVQDRDVNVHPHQIVSTAENMELIILHSYYVDARRKRYMELNHSSHFIFDQLLDELNNTKREK